MTNKEKYKKAFSKLESSHDFYLEENQMKTLVKQRKMKTLALSLVICLLVLGGAGTAYATDFGGIQRTIQLWIEGDQTDATLVFNGDGTYDITYEDEEGEIQGQSGGGVAFNLDGSERPLTSEELMENINAPDVVYNDDGSVWVYYYDQKIDITDKFEDDVCYVKLMNGEETLYMTVKYQNGFSIGPDRYMKPFEFN